MGVKELVDRKYERHLNRGYRYSGCAVRRGPMFVVVARSIEVIELEYRGLLTEWYVVQW